MISCECGFCGKPLFRKCEMSIYFCDINCKSEWQKLNRPVSVEWLRQKYVVEKLDCTAISKLVGRDPKSVWNWLKGSGIETRKRGTTGNWKLVKNYYWKNKKLPKSVRLKISKTKKAQGACPALINGVHWLKVYKDRKPGSWRGGITPERQSFYSTEKWKKAVREVWKRDNAECQRCGVKHNRKIKFAIHHIVSFEEKKLRAKLNNLILLCRECHLWVHSKNNKKHEFIKPTRREELELDTRRRG